MSINWVMLDTNTKSFVPLPREKPLHVSPARTSLTLQTPSSFPGKEPLSIKCSDGKAYITNQRLIYLPTTPTPTLQSFQSPLLSLNDTHVTAPFFGPNVWEGLLTPTPGGGIPPQHHLLQIRLTFKEGGAFDFSTTFERIKETVGQAAEVARENGGVGHLGGGFDLEQLPAYEEAVGSSGGGGGEGAGGRASQPPGLSSSTAARAPAVTAQGYPDEKSASSAATASVPRRTADSAGPSNSDPARPAPADSNGRVGGQIQPAPSEPPPGYEEVHGSSIAENLERRVREE